MKFSTIVVVLTGALLAALPLEAAGERLFVVDEKVVPIRKQLKPLKDGKAHSCRYCGSSRKTERVR